MNKKNITPNPTQPVDRIPTGQLPSALAELSEDTLTTAHVQPSYNCGGSGFFICLCSYDGDDAE